jgi:hypothetical protein
MCNRINPTDPVTEPPNVPSHPSPVRILVTPGHYDSLVDVNQQAVLAIVGEQDRCRAFQACDVPLDTPEGHTVVRTFQCQPNVAANLDASQRIEHLIDSVRAETGWFLETKFVSLVRSCARTRVNITQSSDVFACFAWLLTGRACFGDVFRALCVAAIKHLQVEFKGELECLTVPYLYALWVEKQPGGPIEIAVLCELFGCECAVRWAQNRRTSELHEETAPASLALCSVAFASAARYAHLTTAPGLCSLSRALTLARALRRIQTPPCTPLATSFPYPRCS